MAGTRTAIGRQAPRPARAMGNRGYQHPVRHSPGYRSKPEVERLKKIGGNFVGPCRRVGTGGRGRKRSGIRQRNRTEGHHQGYQARKEILEAFAADEPLKHADLAEDLRLEISLVFEVCNELIDEGLVVFHADNRD